MKDVVLARDRDLTTNRKIHFRPASESWECVRDLNNWAGSWRLSLAPMEPRSTPASEFQGDNMPRILLADDHAAVRCQVREALEAETGFEVCAEAATGFE